MDAGPEQSVDTPLGGLAAPPIFIVGIHRSGTTWVYEMLTAHPEVAGVFESGMFSHNLGIAPLFSPRHWYPDDERLESDRSLFGHPFRLNQLMKRDELLSDARALTESWLGRALQPGDRYLVEKTPQHLQVMSLIDELYPGACFIHVIRDGRDVVVSMEEAGRAWAPRVRQRSRRQIAERWVEAITRAREQAHEGDLRYFEVRYEELLQDPPGRLRELFAFCGIPAEPTLIDRISNETAFELRHSGEDDQFRRRGMAGEWQTRFGLRDRLMFDRVAGELMVELGYARDRRWWWPRTLRRGRSGQPG